MAAKSTAVTALIVGCLVVASFWAGQIAQSAAVTTPSPPERETAVTCYKWVENGTAQVQCPEQLYAPHSVVNITVKECREWQPVVDEPPPCG